ncbi:hypothetical protein H4R20_001027 [Coemansia guatemalensis]|uniref:DH domain-containing protein n=1 Tax=Coemansia guatemalensis TaxID=2761395 RepID=A0A9W8HXT0_9FUNG|nr:hypothetical protein H4R20_001027 [Coemansia guatemalensis]
MARLVSSGGARRGLVRGRGTWPAVKAEAIRSPSQQANRRRHACITMTSWSQHSPQDRRAQPPAAAARSVRLPTPIGQRAPQHRRQAASSRRNPQRGCQRNKYPGQQPLITQGRLGAGALPGRAEPGTTSTWCGLAGTGCLSELPLEWTAAWRGLHWVLCTISLMAKSKILVKVAAKHATSPDHSEPSARPRTAGGERGLLRRFRLGRILFGAGPDAGAPARRDGLHIFRTNSVQAPAPDLPHMSMSPSIAGAQTLPLSPHQRAMRVPAENCADTRKSHYSMLSRRSSAPDVTEITRRLSRHVEEDYAMLAESSHTESPKYKFPGDAAPPLLQTLEAPAELASLSSRRHGSTGSSSSSSNSAAVEPMPNMTRAKLVWKDPCPPSLEMRPASVTTTSPASCSLPDSPALPPEDMDECEDDTAADMAGPKAPLNNVQDSRHSLNSNATKASPPQSRSPRPPAPPMLVLPAAINTNIPRPMPPLPMSPLPAPPTPHQDTLANTATMSATQLPSSAHISAAPAEDMGYIPLRRRNVSEQGGLQKYRPKSLHERPSCRALSALQHRDIGGSAAPRASSIASAKSFLMMIASSHGNGGASIAAQPNSLTNATHEPQSCPPHGNSVSGSAMTTESGTVQDSEQLLHITTGDTSTASKVYNTELCTQDVTEPLATGAPLSASPDVPSSRSLRARSKLAGVGIRRASTYVWNRSSVFVRTLSSTDELPGSNAPPHLPGVSGGACESDMDAGSTKTEDSTSQNSAAALPTLAPTHKMNSAPNPPPLPPAILQRPSKKSPAAMRLHAARELVMTEKNFVDNLFIIKKVWMEPVFSSANSLKPIIPYQTARVVFFGVAALHAHASRFYREMDFALGSYERGQQPCEPVEDDGMRIGALFRANGRHWSDFIAYVRNYGAAVGCLKQLQDYKPYLRYHEECMLQKRTSRQSLKDLLMLPIQRITRYTLLLKNILKHTPAVHSDHIDLCRAVKNVTHFATIVNECRRKQEEIYRTAEVFRSIEHCPPLTYSESRSFVAEYAVRELISRLPTRLMLFSDMLLVAQAPAQAMLDDTGSVGAEAVWTYYGSASLDEVEVQNADESTNTLITILSLNRSTVSANNLDSSRRSLPFGSEQPANVNSTSELQTLAHNGSQCGSTDTSDHVDPRGRSSAGSHGAGLQDAPHADAALKKKKSKSRRGILHTGSRDSIPDHIAALSHSTFPSPVPVPSQLERTQSRLYNASPNSATDGVVDRDAHPPPIQRPKTASGLHSTSSSTLVGHGGPLHSFDLALPHRNQLQDPLPNTLSGTSTGVAGRTDVPVPRPMQLTLVMQHATSTMRKQFVRALKDTTATFINDSLGLGDSDAASTATHPVGDSSSEVLNLHPL